MAQYERMGSMMDNNKNFFIEIIVTNDISISILSGQRFIAKKDIFPLTGSFSKSDKNVQKYLKPELMVMGVSIDILGGNVATYESNGGVYS